MNSMMRPGEPSCSTVSVTATRLRCRSWACTLPSWSRRSRMDWAGSLSTFSAWELSSCTWRTRYTAAMPPSPSLDSTR